MRFFSYVVSLLVVGFVSACGGGGGSPGLSSTNTPTALFSTAPGALSLPLGSSVSYPISGGVTPYAVVADSVGIVSATLNDSVLGISALAVGTSSVIVSDAKGAKISVTVTVPTTPLFTPPNAVTIPIGSTTVAYTITGGTLPYVALSSNPGVMTTALGPDGKSFTITGVGAGSAQVGISDAKGALVTVAVTVPQPVEPPVLRTTAPSAITLASGLISTYSITGGTAPYIATSNNMAVAIASVAGSSGQFLDIKAVASGAASIEVRDAKGSIVTISVTVPAPASLFTTAPPALTLAIGASSEYLISGGVAPYTAVSSNGAFVGAAVSGVKLTITAIAGGSASIVLSDSKGTTLTIAVTVPAVPLTSTAPSSITIAASGVPYSYSISGGTPPYIVKSNNESVATAIVPLGTSGLLITGVSTGAATIVVTDAVGASLSIQVSVPPAGTLFTTATSSVNLLIGGQGTYAISGGTPPYAVSSSDQNAVLASVRGSSLSIAAVSAGNSTVLLTDSKGVSVSISVTVGSTTSLFVNAPSSVNMGPGAFVAYQISGGVAPYTASSSDGRVVTAIATGSSLTLSAIKLGTASISVFDSSGGSVTIAVTVDALASEAFFTTAPAAITLASGLTSSYSIGGGLSPYQATSNNTAIATATVSGTTSPLLNITAVSSGAASVQLRDSKGAIITISVTVPAAGALFTTAPSALTISASASNDFLISGGVAPYQVVSSNQSTVTAAVSGSKLTISGVSGGAASVILSDSKGATLTIAVTVPTIPLSTTAPANVTIDASGTAYFYSIAGGTQFPAGQPSYQVVSSNSAIAAVSIVPGTSSLQIVGKSIGATTVVVTDAKGATLSISVTVAVTAPLLTTAPPNVTLVVGGGATSVFAISGGVPDPTNGYAVISNNGSVAAVTMQADKKSFTLTGNAAGAATIFVTDSKGTQITISVTVIPATPVTASLAAVTVPIGNSTVVTISGGTPAASGYVASSGNTGVAVVQVNNGNNLTIAGVSAGLVTITISDSKGNTFALPVTVPPAGVLYTTAPGNVALAVGENQSYLLAGGTQPYQSIATSTDARVATATVSGGALTIKAVAAGTATIQAFDAVGGKVTIVVTVGSGAAAANFYPTLSGGLSGTDGKIASSGYTTLTVTMKDPSGRGIPNQPIDVAADPKLSFPDGNTALTNASGVATFRIKRASLLVSGAGALAVSYSYKPGSITFYPDGSTPPAAAQVVSTYVGYQLTTANVVLNMVAPTSPMAAYGTQQITVNVTVDGLTSPTPVLVNFSATCGQVTPASVSTNSLGVATTTYSATDAVGVVSTVGCGGKSVEITASTVGADAAVKTIVVTAAPATNMKFVSATPSRIYLKDSGGATQSLVVFQLVNAQDAPILAADVIVSLKTLDGSAVNNVKASFYQLGNVADQTLTTDSNGKVSLPVFSGTVPTSVLVNAKLKSDPKVNTDSAVLVIASGRPAQAQTSISLQKLSIEGWNTDGTTTTVTLSLADRQGNPVPDGTAINFTTSGGVMIPPACNTGVWVNPATGLSQGFAGNSQCTVSIRSQEPRLTNSTSPKSRWRGRVAILAYAAGEEDFVDGNANNIFDTGESYTDLGNAYRDADENGSFDTGEFSVPRSGALVCVAPGVLGGRANTCDGAWGAADVRQQGIIIFATGSTDITAASAPTIGGFAYNVADMNGNSPPTGTTVVVTAVDGTPGNALSCAVVAGASATVGNTLDRSTFGVTLSGCAAADSVNVTVTSPLGVVSSRTFGLQSYGITLPGTAQFTASGTAPFTVQSSDVTKATVSVLGSTVTITGVAVGTATITVTDSRSPEPQRVERYSVSVF